MTKDLRTALVTLREFLPPEENNSITDILDRRSCFLEDDEAAQLIFWILWNWAKGQEWWNKFKGWCFFKFLDLEEAVDGDTGGLSEYLIDPVRFPELVADFLKERKNG